VKRRLGDIGEHWFAFSLVAAGSLTVLLLELANDLN
jgi:hypothetical protein